MADRRKDYRKKTYSSSENIANAANEIGKVPPQARDLEEAVLGSMMIDQDSLDESVGTLNGTISRIEDAILRVLQNTPPSFYPDFVRNGIWLAGGGALLRGIADRFSKKVNIPFHVAEDPLRAVARGTCEALKNVRGYKFLMR